jgi:hypothetical protein
MNRTKKLTTKIQSYSRTLITAIRKILLSPFSPFPLFILLSFYPFIPFIFLSLLSFILLSLFAQRQIIPQNKIKAIWKTDFG